MYPICKIITDSATSEVFVECMNALAANWADHMT